MAATSKNVSPFSDSDGDSDNSNAGVDELRHTDLEDSIFKSYLQITGRSSPPDLFKIKSFLTSSRSGALSCMICLERIRISDYTWSCYKGCYAVFHLNCIQSWGRQASDLAAERAAARLSREHFPLAAAKALESSNWNCPKCRVEYSKSLIPNTYLCYCGKLDNPPSDPWILPHSCGEICGRPLKYSCGHHCLLLCHPGPCPACPKLVKTRCFCGATEDVKRCGFKNFSCNGVCSKVLDCGVHECLETCHEGLLCPPCRSKGVFRCQCGKLEEERECFEREFRCEDPCEKLLGCGKHVCDRGCHLGKCGGCPLQGKRSCPCGKKMYEGFACDVLLPTCGSTCEKVLSCGLHRCPERCHRGSCDETCRTVIIKSCRCGSLKKEVPCRQVLSCERKCQRVRDCGRHACKRRCCDGDCPPCSEICGRKLRCNNHKCPSPCHRGACAPCPLMVTLSCSCGETRFEGERRAKIPDAERIIEHIMRRRHHIAKFTRHSLSMEDFQQYLFSEDLNSPVRPQVHQDMTAPLSNYFIYTGHNSYLTGNQLSSICSDVPIIKALRRGVRAIELDLWPSSSKEDVNVLHGRTLTTPVPFVKCLRSIKEYAFSTSPYPVVITLEDHLTPDLQAKVAEVAIDTFGEMLFYPESECLEQFPSPEELKYRIILSTKPPKEYLDVPKSFKDKGKKDSREEDAWGKEIPDLKEDLEAFDKYSDSDGSEHYLDEDTDSDRRSRQLVAPQYRRLIAIQAKKHKGGLKESLKVDSDKVTRLSLSEHAFEKATKYHGTEIVRFTQKNLLRVYPKGTRVTSSNYKPLLGWMHGAQMVAFNMQGYGRSLWLMHGMFRSNGGCGYVKKPDFLMHVNQQNQVFDPREHLPVRKTLKVKVYMGDGWRLDFNQTHFDAYSPPDFYVRVGIAGVPADAAMKKTEIIQDDWTPIWDAEFLFPLTVPELALLRLEVHEYDRSEKDDFGGQTCLPVSDLMTGIRSVPLYDRKGEKFKSVKLLMCFQFV